MKTNCILGLLEDEVSQAKYKIEGEITLHANKRFNRFKLIADWAKPLCYFEVYRKDSKSRQIHCLLEDASILVFNKKTKVLITILILCPNSLEKYISTIINCIDTSKLDKLYRYAKLNKKSKACKVNNNFEFTEKDYIDYTFKKNKINKI